MSPTCLSKIVAPLPIAILTASILSGDSCVEYPMRIPGYLVFSRSNWFNCRFCSFVGYSPTQCIRQNILSRCSKKETTLSMSSREAPAVDATTGLSVFAIFSSRGQSVKEQLAIFIMSKPWLSIRVTEFSSKGVQIAAKPRLLISVFSLSRSSLASLVSSKRFTYLMSFLFLKSG